MSTPLATASRTRGSSPITSGKGSTSSPSINPEPRSNAVGNPSSRPSSASSRGVTSSVKPSTRKFEVWTFIRSDVRSPAAAR